MKYQAGRKFAISMPCITTHRTPFTSHVLFLLTGSNAKIVRLLIEPCDSDPCIAKKGEIMKLHFKMISGEFSSRLTFSVCAMKQPVLTESLNNAVAFIALKNVGKSVRARLSE